MGSWGLSLSLSLSLCHSNRGGGGGLLPWSSAVLIHPCPPPPISKLEQTVSDICIEEISLWPLVPLFTTPSKGSKGPTAPK